jgi:hypothetical protein
MVENYIRGRLRSASPSAATTGTVTGDWPAISTLRDFQGGSLVKTCPC